MMSQKRKPGGSYYLPAVCVLLFIVASVGLLYSTVVPTRASQKSQRANPIILENQKQGTTSWQSVALQKSIQQTSAIEEGTPQILIGNNKKHNTIQASATNSSSTWTDTSIRGYASQTSINKGQSINFYIGTTLLSYSIQIYRMGWYGGTGARLIQTVNNLPGQNQPIPSPDSSTQLLQLNWQVSYTLQTDTTWVTGVYLAELIGSDGSTGYIIFVIRDDASTADILYQIPIATYEAYNAWGGSSLYVSNAPAGRAYKVSFDRPFDRGNGAGDFFQGDYNMIRFLESQGYNIAYATSVDVQTNSSLLNKHKVFLSNWHDEYWSQPMRANLTNAMYAGKNLAFFDANDIYWQIRFESSAAGVANRVITCYKDASLDPLSSTDPSLTTVTWRDPPVNQPENALLGTMYNSYFDSSQPSVPWVVTNASNWVYNGTGLKNGDSITGLVGNEFDAVWNNGATPTGLTILSNSPVVDIYGNALVANGSVYTYAASNALVFNAGTIRWAWKLDDNTYQSHGADSRVQQMTMNVLNMMIIGSTATPTPSPTPTQSSSSYASTVLSDNPLAYWRLGEAPGSQNASDSSGNNYIGTYSGGITLGGAGAIANDSNTAARSDGTGTVVLPTLSIATNFTIEGWTYLTDANWNSTNDYNNTLYGKWGDVRLLIHPGTSNPNAYAVGYFGVWLNGQEYALTPVDSSSNNTNQWVYWALVRNASTLTLYRNGVQIAQRTDLPATATANISGNLFTEDTTDYFLKGSIDEVAVYTTALTSSRIQAHYSAAQ